MIADGSGVAMIGLLRRNGFNPSFLLWIYAIALSVSLFSREKVSGSIDNMAKSRELEVGWFAMKVSVILGHPHRGSFNHDPLQFVQERRDAEVYQTIDTGEPR